jgi:hypothetical protein
MGALLDRIPVIPLIVVAFMLGVAPLTPEPHLVEKIRWLIAGLPFKPIDWLDLLMHGVPVLILLVKLLRMAAVKAA